MTSKKTSKNYSSHNDFKKDIEKLKNYNIAIVPMFNIFPEAKSLEDDEKFYHNTRGILSECNTSSFKYTSKCMCKTKDYESIAQGNHNAKMHNKRKQSTKQTYRPKKSGKRNGRSLERILQSLRRRQIA